MFTGKVQLLKNSTLKHPVNEDFFITKVYNNYLPVKYHKNRWLTKPYTLQVIIRMALFPL